MGKRDAVERKVDADGRRKMATVVRGSLRAASEQSHQQVGIAVTVAVLLMFAL